ncbi:MAG TPA: phosphoglycolate phosphatase [Aquabacterium sp.]|nr:phosphoglycolate phosphatase [Burkholderiales bacterium]HET8694877.1 phosphoglycolate phosphatase [Aquabacterium sp.]
MIQCITFDLDGTLVDTASEIAEAANRTLADIGLPRRDESDVTRLIGHGTRELMMGLLRQAEASGDPAVVQKIRLLHHDGVMHVFEHHYSATTGTRSELYPEVQTGLDALQQAGIHMACVTNKEFRFAMKVLEVSGLLTYFPIVIGGDSLPRKKPDPSVIRYCLDSLNVNQLNAAHVGDSSIDVETARRAGVAAWVMPYGYNGGQPIEDAQPDHVFATLADVARHVLAQRMAA